MLIRGTEKDQNDVVQSEFIKINADSRKVTKITGWYVDGRIGAKRVPGM